MVEFLLSAKVVVGVGLASVTFYVARERHRLRIVPYNPMPVFVAFLAGSTLPFSIVLLAYPFFDKPPDPASFSTYLPLSGLVLLILDLAMIWKPDAAPRQHAQRDAHATASRLFPR